MDLLNGTLAISASALRAERIRIDTVATNLANAHSTQTHEGGPYRRKTVLFAARALDEFGQMLDDLGPALRRIGVDVVGIVEDDTPARLVFDPGHPDADETGYVAYPNVDPLVEMVDLQAATRAYEANVQVVNATRRMSDAALSIIG